MSEFLTILQYAGIYMSCQVEDSATVVSFTEYEQGLSAVLVVNDTNENIYMRQEFPNSSARCVQVGQSVHYAWEDPRENRQLMTWVLENDVCKVGPLTVGSDKDQVADSGSGKSASSGSSWLGGFKKKPRTKPSMRKAELKFYFDDIRYSCDQQTSSSEREMMRQSENLKASKN